MSQLLLTTRYYNAYCTGTARVFASSCSESLTVMIEHVMPESPSIKPGMTYRTRSRSGHAWRDADPTDWLTDWYLMPIAQSTTGPYEYQGKIPFIKLQSKLWFSHQSLVLSPMSGLFRMRSIENPKEPWRPCEAERGGRGSREACYRSTTMGHEAEPDSRTLR